MPEFEKLKSNLSDNYEELDQNFLIEPLESGLINKTYFLQGNKNQFILQQVSQLIDDAVYEDIKNVCDHLKKKKILFPEFLQTKFKKDFCKIDGKKFRLLKYIDGKSFHTIKNLKMAFESGKILGEFHFALKDFSYEYKTKRKHGGNYFYHQQILIDSLQKNSHRFFKDVKKFSEKIFLGFENLKNNLGVTERHAHGDPKISNILFNKNDEALCLIDFDTLSKTGWSLELADAFRSWCNPFKEDVKDPIVDLKIAEQALMGYAQKMSTVISKSELNEFVFHTQAISLCLSARYLADVLNERYFNFDSTRFSCAAEHNWLRAKSMYKLSEQFRLQRESIKKLVEKNFS